jgi:hypothetical protein
MAIAFEFLLVSFPSASVSFPAMCAGVLIGGGGRGVADRILIISCPQLGEAQKIEKCYGVYFCRWM